MSLDKQFETLIEEGKTKLEALQKRHEEELVSLAQRQRSELDGMKVSLHAEVYSMREVFRSDLKSAITEVSTKSTAITVGIATVAILGVLTFLYSGMKDSYAGMKDVNNAVIQLQQSLVAAQTTIRTTAAELDSTKKVAQDKADAIQKELAAASSALAKTLADNELGAKHLANTQRTYDERLQQLRGAAQR